MQKSPIVTSPEVAADGLIKIDGVTCGRVVHIGSEAYYELKDRNRNRAKQRGTEFLYVPWRLLVRAVEEHLGSAVI